MARGRRWQHPLSGPPAGPSASGPRAAPRHPGIIFDAGHGGVIGGKYQTAGKFYTFTDRTPPHTIREGVVNRRIQAAVIAGLLSEGISPHDCTAQRLWSTPPAWTDLEQRDIPLKQRVAYCRAFPKLPLISIHANAQGNSNRGPSRPRRGLIVYTHPGNSGSDALATAIHQGLSEALAGHLPIARGDWSDGDVDHEANFYILRSTPQEAVLLECGYFDNAQDAAFLESEEAPRLVALGILSAVLPMLEPSHNHHRFRRSSSRAQS